ncbi:efflux RND transporter periplasmic adaptor subunit [Bacteroides sp. 519]|uniref:efflux RND transporter periplasmic adaptor subunit n=1 Tax=Bacteroides sp. 519 TaxID=2302937 RepID=UPI0013D81E5E|nr:efflux RND transporter periplasmic adaptor subunit [Bacteroides sp. 519]NDV59353.1 efflux RND transporter periplasmic adaptor subunit [Bacteroides sp. 519]
MKKIITILLVVALYACSNKPQESEPITDTPAPVQKEEPVANDTDATTGATSKQNEASFNGTIVTPPQKIASVTLTLGGVVKNTSLLPGQYVQRGHIVATLENPEFIELQQLWLESKAQSEFLEAEYKRQQVLAEEQAASQKKFQQSKAEYLSMKSRLESAAAQLSLLGVSVDELEKNGIQPLLKVKAPISGYISDVNMNIGKYINAGEALCEIIDKSQPMLKLTTYEKNIIGLKTNMPVEFYVNGVSNKSFKATITSIGQKVDAVSRSLEVYASIEESDTEFRPGMYVTARIKNK